MIRLIGTSHISPESIDSIEEEIEKGADCVAVELDPARYNSLRTGEEGEYPSLLFKVLSWIQKRLGKETGVLPGEEMLTAVDRAVESEIDVFLVDRPISETMREFDRVGIFEKLRIFLTPFGLTTDKSFNLDEVPPYELVEESIGHLEEKMPGIYSILVEDRNRWIAGAVEELSRRYRNILLVVGIGHIPGIKRILGEKGLNFEDKTFKEHK